VPNAEKIAACCIDTESAPAGAMTVVGAAIPAAVVARALSNVAKADAAALNVAGSTVSGIYCSLVVGTGRPRCGGSTLRFA
jgi:hypothetical protein